MHPESRISVVLVTMYLVLAGLWLLVTRRIPGPGLLRVARAAVGERFAGSLFAIEHAGGNCYVVHLPAKLLSDLESASRVRLFEGDTALGPAHATHAEIREKGGGRYSHWGSQLYFSTSDNSDPRLNGRTYVAREASHWGI